MSHLLSPRSRPSDRTTIIFPHIHKTGGMTFGRFLARHYRPERVLNLDADTVEEVRVRLAEALEARREPLELVYGHIPYGVHELLPTPSVYVTLLRHPADRIVSAYFYWLRRPEIHHHADLLRRGLSLDEFVSDSLSDTLHDEQTRVLSGDARASVETVLQNFERRFAVVGLTERFDESVLLARARLGLRSAWYHTRNKNRRRPRFDAIARHTIAAIEARNPLDLALHRHAEARLEEALSSHAITPRDIARFRRVNRVYDSAGRVAEMPVALLRDLAVARRRTEVARS